MTEEATPARSWSLSAWVTLLSLAAIYLALLAFVWWHDRPPVVVLAWSLALGATLVVLSAIDIACYRLPNLGTIGLTVFGLLATAHLSRGDLTDHIAAVCMGFAFLAATNALYRLARGRDGIGGGDAKLLAAAGAWTGIAGVVATLLWATLIALLMFVGLAIMGRRIGLQSALPFGPFLALALWITWLFGPLQTLG